MTELEVPDSDLAGQRPGVVRRAASATVRRWMAFWFTPMSASVITGMRVMIGGCSVLWALSILPDLRTFYFEDGLLPGPRYADQRLALFQWLDGDRWVVAVFVVLVVAAIAVTFGRIMRVAAPLLWITMVTMQLGAPEALNAGDMALRIWTAYLALFAVCTPSRFLSVPLFGRRDGTGGRVWPTAPAWMVRLVQVQLTVVYPATVIAKLDGDTWRDGTAALYALGLQDFERFWIPDLIRENLLIGNLMTWYTIAVEFALGFLLWTRRTRWIGILAGLSIHIGFDYVMRLGFFLPAMAVGYLSFVRPEELERLLDTARRLRTGVRRRVAPLVRS